MPNFLGQLFAREESWRDVCSTRSHVPPTAPETTQSGLIPLCGIATQPGLRGKAFQFPRVVGLADIAKAVVQAVEAALPEFDSLRF